MEYTITQGTRPNALEVYFDGKPSEDVRNALKALKMRWHNVKKCWYGFTSEEALKEAITTGSTTEALKQAKRTAEKAQAVNKYGVKVGDVFHMSWGYDQTNNDYFQVVEIVGAQMVRVKSVAPQIINTEAVSGMSCHYEVAAPNGEMWKPEKINVFVKDNEKGDLKKVQQYTWNGTDTTTYINIDGHHATLFHGGKVYESWYA